MKIYINAAHKPCSPGAVFMGRNEHQDILSFCRLLCSRLERAGFLYEMFSGYEMTDAEADDIVLIFHRDTSYKNAVSDGASAVVSCDAAAEIQYEAFCMLETVTKASGFRYRGVHTLTNSYPHMFIEKTGVKRTFLFNLGFIESEKDNSLFDCHKKEIADALAKKISEIYMKERINEDYS